MQHSTLTERLDFEDIDIFAILFHMHEGVLITDQNGVILFYNAAQSQIDDFDIDYAVGKKITDLYKLSENDSTTMRCIRTGRPIRNHVIVYQTRLGKVANTISNVFPLYKKGKSIGAISFTKDYQMLEEIISSSTPKTPSANQPSTQRSCYANGTRFLFSDLIGKNTILQQAIDAAKLAADSPSPIMLSGETGTGKELFAQSIHNFRKASTDKFIPINCSAIPENLLEGILFGTSRGAFTGSIDKAGLFEQANGGTIFLDELDSMPMALQAKVLRVVQEKRVRRLGSLEEIDLDVKIVSTVSKDPHQIIKTGALRLDLFYRMGVVFITIPPLRERMDDLDALVAHFINKLNTTLNKQVIGLSQRVSELFRGYVWPGNVRELEHVIEGAMNMVTSGKSIMMKHLPSHVLTAFQHPHPLISQTDKNGETSGQSSFDPSPNRLPGKIETPPIFASGQGKIHSTNDGVSSDSSLYPSYPSVPPFHRIKSVIPGKTPPESRPLTLSEAQCASEQESICYALKSTQGNAAKAARMLGISPQSFHYKLKKYKIDRKDFFDEDQ